MNAEERCYLWLDSFALELSEKRALLKEAGGAVALVKDFLSVRPFFERTEKLALFEKMQRTLQDEGEYFSSVVHSLERSGVMPIPQPSPLYPKAWRAFSDAPLCVYAKGNAELLKERFFVVVGSRRTPATANKTATEIAKELSEVFCVVTGTAGGGDAAAAQGALAGSGKLVLVHAGGLNTLPQGNSAVIERTVKTGLVLSPYPMDTAVRAFSYEYRNKLLAALGEGVLVVGAGEKSGALITAKYAEKSGKPIFALPYPPNAVYGAGCNGLIKRGGALTENASDIFLRLGIDVSKTEKSVPLNETEEKVYAALKEANEAHVSELAATLGLPPFKVTTALSALEVKGLAVSLGGNRYAV